MDSLDYLRQNESVLAQPSDTNLVLFQMDSGHYYSLNELGSRVWSLCDGTRSFAELIGIVASEYDAPIEVIEQDCKALTARLVENHLLIRGVGEHGFV